MQTRTARRAAYVAAISLVLVGCSEGIAPSDSATAFQKQYNVARDALEGGRFQAATRQYRALLPAADGFEPRIRLELAHAYLRNGDYPQAAQEARTASQQMDLMAKAGAQAVLGTALHEMALAARQQGDSVTARKNLQAAQANLDTVLASYPELDPLGALAGRQAAIKVQLSSF